MKKMIIAAATLAVCMTGIFAYTGRANDISMGFTFDNGILPDWEPLYNNADMSIEKEENENKYLKLSYNGNANRGREYFDVECFREHINIQMAPTVYPKNTNMIFLTDFHQKTDMKMEEGYTVKAILTKVPMIIRL